MYTSVGTFRYDPRAKTIERKPWWAILDCCPDLSRYYRWSYWQYFREKIQTPAWGTHISLIRGEEPPNKEMWGAYEGLEIEFEYDIELFGNDVYFWLNARCDKLLDIREELGLPRKPLLDLHVTIGRIA